MARLRTLAPRVATLNTARRPSMTTAAVRMTGRALQARRLRIWAQDPHCAMCGRLVALHEFDLDHRVPLYQGGQDVDANCQVLCNVPDGGCHRRKTAEDAKGQ